MSNLSKKLPFLLLLLFVGQSIAQNAAVVENLRPNYYAYDGRDNNLKNPDAGNWSRPAYRGHYDPSWAYNFKDGLEEVDFDGINPRQLSNELAAYRPKFPHNRRGVNALHMTWGAYAGHDLARYGPRANTDGTVVFKLPSEDKNNIWQSPGSGEMPTFNAASINFTIPRCRAHNGYVKGTTPRNYMSNGTPWMDLDSIYGKDYNNIVANVNQSTGLFVLNQDGFPTQYRTFGAADTVLKTLFPRIHNYYALKLKERNSSATPRDMYNEGRRWNIAFFQSITMYEYASILFNGPMPVYSGYNESVTPTYFAEIGPIVVHYPYSEFTGQFEVLDEDWNPITQPQDNSPFMLTQVVQWELAKKYGLEALARGAIHHVQHNVDLYFSDDFRANPHSLSTSDSFTRLWTRTRETGIPNYNNLRRAWGLAPKTSFEEISPDLEPAQIALLKKFFNNSIEKVDAWTGMHAEWRADTHMGELMTKIYKPYWLAVRDGDRFWFEGSAANFTEEEKTMIRNTKVSDLLIKFMNLTRVPCSAFYSKQPDCPSAPPSDECPNSEPNTVQFVNDKYLLKWQSKLNDSVTFRVQAATTGFVALGFPINPGKMLGTTAFIGMVTNQGASVNVYTISARSPCTAKNEGVCPNNTTPYRITDVSGYETDGATFLEYTVSPVPPGTYNMVASFGKRDVLEYHEDNTGSTRITIPQPDLSQFTPTPSVPTCPVNSFGHSSAVVSLALVVITAILALFI
jgi:hypothetical protein